MIYIGDSDTDIPCMKLVNSYGGHSIGVYNPETKDKTKVYKMMRDSRIKYFAPSDYSDGTELDKLVKSIIARTAANEVLENYYYQCKRENIEADNRSSEESRQKMDLILSLESSRSFATTHSIIKKMNTITSWTAAEKENLFKIACQNSQVRYLLGDKDVNSFFKKLLKGVYVLSENGKSIKTEVEKEE